MKVRAVYDFSGEPGTAELSIKAGEVLTVTRQDVGEGWWEGSNEAGRTGLFPAAYVEEMPSSQPPAMPPPPLPETFADPTDWGDTHTSQQHVYSNQQSYEAEDLWDDERNDDTERGIQNKDNDSYEAGDLWDDEWDDDSEGGGAPSCYNVQSSELSVAKSRSAGDIQSIGQGEGKGTVGRKNFNRFSTFVKSGAESYILGMLKINVPDPDKVTVLDSADGPVWNPITEPYSCMVASPKKETKLKGLKSFIAYQITPTFNNIQVSRRYKHFDWLHERLEEKFNLIPIPPLPDKQISGRYEEQFIEHRKNQLQLFVDSVCRHPVLSRCAVWEHFLTCTDAKRWKAGKRRAEKDELVGPNYFLALQAPETPIELFNLELETEKCSKFVQNMDGAVKNLMATALDQTKKHQGPYKREYQKIGMAFHALGEAFIEQPPSPRAEFHKALKETGDAYTDIGLLFEDQPKVDWEPLGDLLHLYKGIIASFPDILSAHKHMLQKRKECEKMTADHKMEPKQRDDVIRRTDVVSYALLAEINHFHSERAVDFNIAMQKFLNEQIVFYQKIVEKLQTAVAAYSQ